MKNRIKYYAATFLPYILFYFLIVIILPKTHHKTDILFWEAWTKYILKHGLGDVYNYRLVNYQPVFLYFLKLFGWSLGSPEAIHSDLIYVKTIPFSFDVLGAISVLFILPSRRYDSTLPFLLLFNLAYLYNSIIWGQVDAIDSGFVFMALVGALLEKPLLASIFFVLALNTKLQVIVFLPVFLLALLPVLDNWMGTIKVLVAVTGVQILILLPFILSHTLDGLLAVMQGAVHHSPVVSMNAFNLWHLLLSGNLMIVPDTIKWHGLSYEQWGLLLFFALGAAVMLPVGLITLRVLLKREEHVLVPYKVLVILSAALVAVLFFFFNTRMHERYGHPALILFFAYGCLTGRYGLYVLVSIACFLNLEAVLRAFDLNYSRFYFQPSFIATLFLLVIVWGAFELYRNYRVFGNQPGQ